MSKQDRVVAENIERVDPVVPMFRSEMIMAVVIGLGVGLVVAGFAYLLDRFVFSAVLCQLENSGECANAENYSMIVAMVIGSIAGLVALVQARIYRPLLVVLASAISLWGLQNITSNMQWYWALIVSVVLFGLSYALFTWLARIRSFVVAAVAVAVVVVAVRLAHAL